MALLDNTTDPLGPGIPLLCFVGTCGSVPGLEPAACHRTSSISSFLQGLMQGQLSPSQLPLTGQGPENRRGRSMASLPL